MLQSAKTISFKVILHNFVKILLCQNVIINAIGDINKHSHVLKIHAEISENSAF